jgi:TPR repeat protein
MKEGAVLRVVGMNGQIELHEDRVVISRRGMTAVLLHGFKGEKASLLSEISSIQSKASGLFSGRGFIQFSFRGGTESKGDIREMAQDENAVLFTGGRQAWQTGRVRSRPLLAAASVVLLAWCAPSLAGLDASFERTKELADQGDPRAEFDRGDMYALGDLYAMGVGVPQDYAEAVKWYREDAEQGNANAQFNLGFMYSAGQGVPQDYTEAVKWFREAAEQGHAGAQNNLGFMYHAGQGVPQDDAEAVTWYRKAAEQGEAVAQISLGVMYANGRGVRQDHAEAFKWYRKAAEQGHAGAQNNLGFIYADGQGVPQDYVQAHKWLNLSAAQGEAIAAENRDIIAKRMTPEQIAEAQKLARNWKPTPAKGVP